MADTFSTSRLKMGQELDRGRRRLAYTINACSPTWMKMLKLPAVKMNLSVGLIVILVSLLALPCSDAAYTPKVIKDYKDYTSHELFYFTCYVNTRSACQKQIKLSWIPGFAPPIVGDSKSNYYQLEPKQVWPFKIGIAQNNPDGTRLVGELHPWKPARGVEGDYFDLQDFHDLVSVTVNGKKGTAAYTGNMCADDHKKAGDPTTTDTMRFHIDGPNVNKICGKPHKLKFEIRNGFGMIDGISFEDALSDQYITTNTNTISFSRDIYISHWSKRTGFFTVAVSDIHRVSVNLPSTDLFANNEAIFTFNVLDENKNPILNAGHTEAMISISRKHKTFTDSIVNSSTYHLIKDTTATNSSDFGVTKLENNDEVIIAPFKNGSLQLQFGVQEVGKVDISVTIKQKYGYGLPLIENDKIACGVGISSSDCENNYDNLLVNNDKASTTVFSVDVKSQTPHKTDPLRLVNPGQIQDDQTIFIPLDGPVELELVDEDNKRIVSGPHANLAVTAIALVNGVPDYSGKMLAIEKTFNLEKGHGIFPGSIVKMGTKISLKFEVDINSSKFQTAATQEFTLHQRISHLVDARIGSEGEEDYHYKKLMPKDHRLVYAKNNKYNVELENFLGEDRLKYIFDTRNGVVDRLATHITTDSRRDDNPEKWDIDFQIRRNHLTHMKQLAIIGSTDKDTALYASKAKASGMILISDASTSDEFTDKSKHGNVFRLSFADSYRYATLANFLHSRSWKVVSILHGDKGVPGELTAKLNLFGIRYVTTSFPRGVDGAKPVNKDTDSFFDNIKSSEVKVIVSVLDQTDLKYLIDAVAAEPEEDQLSTSNGYIWIFDGSLSDATQENPFESREGVTISNELKIKKVKPFENGLVMRTYYEHFNLKSRAFQEACAQMDTFVKSYICTSGVYEEGQNFHEGLMFYDAYAIYRESLLRLQLKQQTITAESLATEMRNYREPIDLSAMYGSLKYAQYKGPQLNTIGYHIKFDENNDRKNYTARLLQLHAPDPSQGNQIITSKKLLLLGEDVTTVNIKDTNKLTEVHFQEDREGGKVEQLVFQTDWIEEEDEDDVLVEVEVPVAPVGIDENSVVSLNSNYEKGKTNTQTVSLPFYCKGSCGGKRLNPALADGKYEKGTCVWNYGTKCICNSGYEGSSCQVAQCPKCNVDNGACVTPGVCTCKQGYKNDESTGIACDIGHCEGVTSGSSKGCNPLGGTCQGGNTCKCSKSFYGPACRGSCKCKNSGLCEDGAKGSGACDCTGTGYFGQYCHIHTDTVVVCGALGFVLFLVLFGLGVRYRMRQIAENHFLMSTDWRATWDEVKTKQANQRSSKKSMMSLMSMVSGAASGKDATKLTCANQAVWNGRDVVYKVIRKDRCELGPELREEIKQVRQMAHPNICMFIGACLDAPNICILNEVCGKGSMEDILNNDDVNLGWDFKFSMMKDIARGMTYISNSVIESHGRLKSSNCLVDSRWCVKLADFGFQGMKAGQQGVSPYQPINEQGVPLLKSNKDMEGSDHFNLLWTAPEILATGVSHLDHVGKGTIRGDIYSMAMIMTEMCAHAHPYHEQQHLNPMQLIGFISRLVALDQKLQKTECRDIDGIPVYVLRPLLNDDNLPENTDQAAGLRTLIETCWNQDKMGRPDWNTLMKCLNKICPHSGELMDNLINLMESYTCSLEMIVAERTANIQEEKLKGDALLAKMLPPLICEELKSGKNPQPEFFKSVTIYFSDIVGFGALTSECAPIQVVAILNGLYEIMDSVIDSHDVYKVETIGDCYMVVSGLPIRNGDRHAGEICNMSLELLQAFNGVSYVGYEKKQVQLRVGIHSGPCVAGVVGTKMPRYCLFGDTVNTASRMESGGFALKIHLSSDTYTILERLGGYKANCRGEIAVKGRGQMTTYWLQGREGTEYNLPSEDLALSASQHYFK